MTIQLKHVKYIPAELEENILYVSDEFEVATHLCPCGCKNKIVTPLGINEWKFTESNHKPSLYPSIGNWQLPCRSHYWITDGQISWAGQWSEQQIKRGQRLEQERDKAFYENFDQNRKKRPLIKRIINWIFRK